MVMLESHSNHCKQMEQIHFLPWGRGRKGLCLAACELELAHLGTYTALWGFIGFVGTFIGYNDWASGWVSSHLKMGNAF